ncbi:PIN-like domain-containing protein [Actinomadura geliboluensis]|uniref:PIN-like domain-containing protein n=1 Tax=Actinomadura geliboluensis TaxID=882440 RepID=UPI00371EDC55
MSEQPDERQPDLAGLRDRFPAFFPPDDVQVKDFITTGMVAFDTNALLDVYRLNPQAREEYLAALRKLGDRLFVPHRVGQELMERRLTVIEECSTATDVLATELSKPFDTITQLVRSFGNRRGLSAAQKAELEKLATEARDALTTKAREFYDFGMDLDTSLKGEAILAELVRLLDGKVGPPVADPKKVEAEAKRRIENRVPPGFMDAKKNPDRAIGDYLIWRQIMDRATEAKLSVVLVTNDQKPDWVREDLGRKLGAHPDLVAEMMEECGLPFHLVSVQSFLVHAREYLGATVSEGTILQAEQPDEGVFSLDPEPRKYQKRHLLKIAGGQKPDLSLLREIREMERVITDINNEVVTINDVLGKKAARASEREKLLRRLDRLEDSLNTFTMIRKTLIDSAEGLLPDSFLSGETPSRGTDFD